MRKLLLALTLALACRSPEPATPPVDRGFHPEWSKNAVIYEVNVRQYTPEGTFNAFAKELPRLKALGVDILWFMPIQPIGKLNRKGTLGSYYSIANYTGINPEFGTQADFKALVDAAHAQGTKVVLDWVANHTAFDHPWTKDHKDWYTLRPDGSISRAIDDKGKETDWTDVAQLNYKNADMRAAMIGEMKWWLDTTGIDGFRCDAAGFMPREFWKQVSDAFRPSRPGFFMLAEWEDPKLHESFDMTYGWGLHHLLNDVSQGKKGATDLAKYFATEDSAYAPGAYRMDFTSNHDENSWNGTEFERMGDNHLPSFVLSATAQRSMPLIYSGQEAAFKKRLRFFDKDTIVWTDTTLRAFYRSTIALKHTQSALGNGPWGARQALLKQDGGERVFAFTRTLGANTVAVFVNFDSTAASVKYDGMPQPGAFVDWYSHTTTNLGAAGTVEIPKHGYRVFVRGATSSSP